MMEGNELIRFIQSVPGFCTQEDCALLYRLVSGLSCRGDILEIGAFKGRTTAVLAKALIDADREGTVYSVDANLFGTKEELLDNLRRAQVDSRVVNIFKDSVGANNGWARPLKFIWIDADGTYLSARSDFILWERFLVTGGIIAISCVANPDIQRVIRECLVSSGRFSDLQYTAKLCFAVKQKQAPAVSFIRLAYVRFLYGFYLFSKKVLYAAKRRVPFVQGKDSRLKSGIKRLFDRFL
jgi:hypothetical protein